jgi:hypothetical protein
MRTQYHAARAQAEALFKPRPPESVGPSAQTKEATQPKEAATLSRSERQRLAYLRALGLGEPRRRPQPAEGRPLMGARAARLSLSS